MLLFSLKVVQTVSVLILFSHRHVSSAAESSAPVSSAIAVEKIVYWRCLPLAAPSIVLRIAFLVLEFLFLDLLEELWLCSLLVCLLMHCFTYFYSSKERIIIFSCWNSVKNIYQLCLLFYFFTSLLFPREYTFLSQQYFFSYIVIVSYLKQVKVRLQS